MATVIRSLLLLLLAATGVASAAEPKEWRFNALLDGKPIGYHHFRLVETDGKRELTSEARFKVKLLLVTVYTYVHDDKELYQGDCLTSIDARTDDNGDKLMVKGSQDAKGFAVTDGKKPQTLPACIMTFAYWNPHMLEGKQLLNSQTGRYDTVKIEKVGEESILASGKQQSAIKYLLTGDKLKIELWYSKDMQWLGLQSTAEGGRKLLDRLE
jgi:hypothetical protein